MNIMGKKRFELNKIVIIVIICIIVFAMLSIVFANLIRKNNINKQALEYINYDLKQTTIFCSGNNLKLNSEVLNKLKEEKIDLVINNSDYIATIDFDNLEKNINLKINIKKNVSDYTISSQNIVKGLKINVINLSNDYVSQYANDQLISNKIVVDEQGYADLILDGSSEYRLAYVIPEDIVVEDMTLTKGETKTIDIGINNESYTYGAIKVKEYDSNALEISYMDIKGNEVGEYKVTLNCGNLEREMKVIVEQGVEKIELSSLTVELIEGNEVTINATVIPESAVNKNLKWLSSDETIASIDQEGKLKALKEGNCEITVETTSEPKVNQKLQVSVKSKINSITNISSSSFGQVEGITYINGIMLVNKTHSVPQDYAPGLQSSAYNAFLELREAAAVAGYDIQLLSGYRSYETQKGLYERYVATYGQAEADTFSARPGTSEHQTGLAMDVGWIDDAYADTPSGKWLAANCYKYGFIIRYPKSKEAITGYKYEPWHIRYLGKDIAKDVFDSGLCLEEYLGVTN